MATRNGLVKKTALDAYSRPKRGGIIAIKLREGRRTGRRGAHQARRRTGDLLRPRQAIRFRQSDARPMGRNSSGVHGIRLRGEDRVVGMVVADPAATLLTACERATASAPRSARTARRDRIRNRRQELRRGR